MEDNVIETLRRWLGIPPGNTTNAGPDTRRRDSKQWKPTADWVLNVRPPMGPRPAVKGGVYEWGLTLMNPYKDRVCRISGIWFFATRETTIAARETIEHMRHERALTRAQLCALIDEHRVPGSPVYLHRRIDTVQRTEQFESGTDEKLIETLEWGGING